MERAELERLDRDSLIARAESLGVTRASVLTRPELVDELLLRGAKQKDDPAVSLARGLFGRARDLLARVIERGLHLPEAADLVRARPSSPPPPRTAASVVPTVTLAEIYAAQGHKERALDTLRRVLESEPDHAPARMLYEKLDGAELPAPELPPEEDEEAAMPAGGMATGDEAPPAEPMGMLDDAPLPPKYDVDECVTIPVDPRTMFIYWEVRDETRAHLERTRPGGSIYLRVLVIEASWDGPKSHTRDIEVYNSVGDWFVRDLPAECVVRAAIGWHTPQGAFVPVAHSPALEAPSDAPSAIVGDDLVRWTPDGVVPITLSDADAKSIQRAVDRVHQKEHARRRRGGSSEMSMG